MSHLTDGQLHAYLDGSVEALDGATLAEARSHIAACDDCSARLEAARLVRDEAVSLLGTAAPSSFSPPPFEELERRAALVGSIGDNAGEPPSGGDSVSAKPTGAGRRSWRPGSLAWAASLAVALTAGWMARGTVGMGGDDARFRVALPSTEAPSDLNEGRGSRGVPPTEFPRGQAEPEEEGTDRPRVDRAAMDELATETSGEGVAPLADKQAPVEEGIAVRRLEAGNGDPPSQPELQRALEPGSERAAAKMAQSDVAGLPSAGRGSVEGPSGWQPVGREQAEALLGGALKTVEGLPILSVYARSSGVAPEVWTAQQLASGHQLNLRQTPLRDSRFGDLEEAGAANEHDEPAADPASGIDARPQQQAYYETLQSLFIDGFLIEATAPLTADSLRVLLSRLKD
jgi:hypothetical protein